MVDVEPGEVYSHVSSDLSVSLIFWVWMFGVIASSSAAGLRNQFGAINPAIMFSVGLLGLGFIAFREANDFQQLKKVLGLDTRFTGFGIFLSTAGIGLGGLAYAVFTRNLLAISTTPQLTSIAQPFYNPYTASATGFSIGTFTIVTSVSILFLHIIVGVFEESYKMGVMKNLTNGIHKATRKYEFLPTPSISGIVITATMITFILWGAWHYFSWDGLTLASIIMAVIYGAIFYSGYYLLAAANIINPQEISNKELAIVTSGIVLYTPVTTHITWNYLVSTQGANLATSTLVSGSLSIFILSVAALWVVKKIQT